jgi:hypothetical protein
VDEYPEFTGNKYASTYITKKFDKNKYRIGQMPAISFWEQAEQVDQFAEREPDKRL